MSTLIHNKNQIKKHDEQITRFAGLIFVATLCSRVFGFVRDALVAYLFGATGASDAFYAAYRIANLFRRLFGEGAFSSAFIPVFAQIHTEKKNEEIYFARVMLGNLLTIVILLTMLGIVFAPWLVRIIASGFSDNPEQLMLTIRLTRIMFPYFVFISAAACVMGVLQTNKKFFIPALAPLSLSVSIIAYILIVIPVWGRSWTLTALITGLAISVLVGGLGQFLFMVPSFIQKGYSILPKIKFGYAGTKRVFKLMIPAMFGISVDQINMFISATFLASFLAHGTVTALYYADRVTQLPLALFGLALASVALPLLAKTAAQKNIDEFKKIINFSIRMIGFLTIPAAVGLIVLGYPIITILFERGVFDARASSLTYQALVPFAVGMVALSLVKILANSFFSLQDTKRPVMVASVCMIINIVLSIVLMRFFDIAGLATASAISAIINATVLGVLLKKKIGSIGFTKILRAYSKIIVASVVMGFGVYAASKILGMLPLLMSVSCGVVLGLSLYVVLSILLNIEERHHVYSLIKRKTLPAHY